MTRSNRGLIGDMLARKVASRVSVLRLFRSFDFVYVTVEKVDSLRSAVVNTNRNLIARSDNEEYFLLA